MAKSDMQELTDVVLDFETYARYSAFSIARMRKAFFKPKTQKYLLIFIAGANLLSVLYYFINNGYSFSELKDARSILGVLGAFLVGIMILFYLYALPKLQRRAIRAAYDGDAFMRKSQNYLFDDNGFVVTSESMMAKYLWQDVILVVETKYFLALYIAKMRACVIPANHLEGKQQVLSFIKSKTAQKYEEHI